MEQANFNYAGECQRQRHVPSARKNKGAVYDLPSHLPYDLRRLFGHSRLWQKQANSLYRDYGPQAWYVGQQKDRNCRAAYKNQKGVATYLPRGLQNKHISAWCCTFGP